MSFSIGIVGLPNVGKSTLFTALTKQQVDAANYPFCTIDPNVGTVAVPDDRLDQLARVCSSAKVVPTVVEFVDIAGLVAGAHRGEGLGNQFLSHIRTVDAICEVVRQFADPNVVHVAGRVDPASDQETIKLELVYADLATVEKRIADTAPKARSGDTVSRQSLELYEKVRSVLNAGTLLSEAGLSDDERLAIRDLNLLTTKPVLYVLNVGESAAATPVPGYVVISAKVEAELSEMSPADALEFLRSLGLQKTGLDQLIAAAYRALNLVTFFAAGPTESRAWTVERASTIQQAAGKIHTDFERAFVRAEIIGWQDFVRAGSEAAAKAQGLMHLEGRGYLVQDGDTVYIHANA